MMGDEYGENTVTTGAFGTPDPEPPDDDPGVADIQILPPPSDPMAVARKLLGNWITDEGLTLRHWRGGWIRWQTTHWAEVEDREIRSGYTNRWSTPVIRTARR